MGNLANIENNFKSHGIVNFTPAEITATGAKLEDVKILTFSALQEVRTKIKRRIHLLRNGITTGSHVSPEHPEGKAVDFHLDLRDGDFTSRDLITAVVSAIRAGFNGIGVYWNGQAYSFHFDLRPVDRFALWIGYKNKVGAPWRYVTLVGNTANVFDPKTKMKEEK